MNDRRALRTVRHVKGVPGLQNPRDDERWAIRAMELAVYAILDAIRAIDSWTIGAMERTAAVPLLRTVWRDAGRAPFAVEHPVGVTMLDAFSLCGAHLRSL